MEGITSVDKAVAVLRVLANRGRNGMRLADVFPAAVLSKSTAHRVLQSLIQIGMVEQDPDTGLYFLGYDLFSLGIAAGNRFGLVDLSQSSMIRLAERTGDTVYLSIRDRLDSVCVAREEGAFPIKTLTLSVGDRRPLGVGAGGLGLLAFADDEDIRAVVRANFSRPGIYSRYNESVVHGMIEDSRRQGYSVNDGNVIDGMSAIGVPIRGVDGIVASLSIAAVTERMRPPRRPNIIAWLQAESAEIERLLRPLGRAALNFGR